MLDLMREGNETSRVGELCSRLRGRREEIEGATLARAFALSQRPDAGWPEYAEGLRGAVAAGVEHGIASLEDDEGDAPGVPAVLLAQARLAARSRVGLDTVLRRYMAGHALLVDFVVQETGGELPPAELKRVLLRLSAVVDRIAAAVSGAYREETEKRSGSRDERRKVERVERLLAGEPLDASGLGYDLDGAHLAMNASGPGALEATKFLARSLDCRLLTVSRRDGSVWIWLGGRSPVDARDLELLLRAEWPPRASLALGEPGEGVGGWRLSHQQARAALPIAVRSPEPYVRYADVALLAAMLQDDLLATSLRRLYLEPLEGERDGGATLRETLRTYFAAGRNAASAAAALGVSRQTVNSRLRGAEERLDRPLDGCAAELQTALRLHALSSRQSG